MKNFTLLFLFLSVLYFSNARGQSETKPWSFSVNANLINLTGDETEKSFNLGGPAFAFSRYISNGFSLGSQLAFGKADNFNVSYNYLAFDGFVKFNLTDGNFIPYLIGGYGLSLFSDDLDRVSTFPSPQTGRTLFGGIGFNFYFNEALSLNIQSSYRAINETDVFSHLQSFVGLSYGFGSTDADGDGVPNKKDKCPNVPGSSEYEGCPDTDGDTIIDKDDRCPEIAGVPELNGCVDTDGDGIADPDDVCPEKVGIEEMNGCPDTDGDGTSDLEDACLDTVGPIENKGCPWPDQDGDGIPDKDDLCLDEKGTAANNGCPELSPEIVETLNEYGSRIYFPANSSQLFGKKTKDVLEQIKSVLLENPKGNILIQGYTSSDGGEDYNIDLSRRRAEAVLEYLVDLGVPPIRLEVEGYGELDPLEDNSNPKGRAMNRRVQFKAKRN